MQINIKVSCKVILPLLIDIINHSQSTQSNKFAISLQNLKEEVRDGVLFLHAEKYTSLYKLALTFLMEETRHVQSTQNIKLVIFLQYIKKKSVATPFVFCCGAKHSDILLDHFRCYLFLCKST